MRNPLPAPQLTERQLKAFSSRYAVGAEDECWIWEGQKNPKGYGEYFVGGRNYKAHRIAYYLHTGDWPADRLVCHSCDNPSCVNPHHLWLGTAQDNSDDMVRKGRTGPRGSYAAPYCAADGLPAPRPRLSKSGKTFAAFEQMHNALVELAQQPGHVGELAKQALAFPDSAWPTIKVAHAKSRDNMALAKPAKLTEAQVGEIRASTLSHKEAAEKFGVKPEAIRRLRKNMTWRHLA